MSTRSYLATLRARSGVLLGGVKRVDSVHFQTKKQAEDWLEAIKSGQQNKDVFGIVAPSQRKIEIYANETGHKSPRKKNPAGKRRGNPPWLKLVFLVANNAYTFLVAGVPTRIDTGYPLFWQTKKEAIAAAKEVGFSTLDGGKTFLSRSEKDVALRAMGDQVAAEYVKRHGKPRKNPLTRRGYIASKAYGRSTAAQSMLEKAAAYPGTWLHIPNKPHFNTTVRELRHEGYNVAKSEEKDCLYKIKFR